MDDAMAFSTLHPKLSLQVSLNLLQLWSLFLFSILLLATSMALPVKISFVSLDYNYKNTIDLLDITAVPSATGYSEVWAWSRH